MDYDSARMRHLAMFPNINALPGAERETAADDWDAEVHGGERGSDMGRHIVVAFHVMLEHRAAIAHKAFEKFLEIAAYRRIGIFLDQE